jgi:nitrogen fixation protein FixH
MMDWSTINFGVINDEVVELTGLGLLPVGLTIFALIIAVSVGMAVFESFVPIQKRRY